MNQRTNVCTKIKPNDNKNYNKSCIKIISVFVLNTNQKIKQIIFGLKIFLKIKHEMIVMRIQFECESIRNQMNHESIRGQKMI